MTIDFNKKPYFDDYDHKKNYKKILFKPGLPVQARELNQIQSMFTNEIGALSDHIFKNGSRVSNCRSSMFIRDYVRLDDLDFDGIAPKNPTVIKPRLVGDSSGVEAILTNFHDYVNGLDFEPYTINVIYTKTGIDSEQSKFLHGEDIIVYGDDDVEIGRWSVRCPECEGSTLSPEISPTGKSYFYGVDEGVIYYEKMYGYVSQQEILIEKYITYNTDGFPISDEKFKVGLDVSMGIVTSSDDTSLLDNSLGYPNASAEGADRLQIGFKLVKRSYDFESGDKFIVFGRYAEHYNLDFSKVDIEYSTLLKEFARRTYEQAGDFTVSPFSAQFMNQKKQTPTDSNGYSILGDEEKLVAIISSGIAYVTGYRVQKDGVTILPFDKARDTRKVEKFAATLNNRQYMKVDIKSSNVIFNNEPNENVISLRDVLLYDGAIGVGDTTGTQIGIMKVIDQSNDESTKYTLYVYDVAITQSGKTIKDIKSFKTADGNIYGNMILEDGKAVIYDTDSTGNIYKLPMSDVKSLRSIVDENAGSITLKVRRKLTGTLNSAGKISFTGSSNEYFEGYNPFNTIVTLDNTRFGLLNNHYGVVNNTLSIDVGASHAGKKIVAIVDVTRFNQKEKIKVLRESTFTTTTAPSGIINNTIPLAVADGYKLISAKVVHPTAPEFEPIDVTSEYEFVGGQTKMFYTEAKLKRITNRSNIDNNLRLQVSFEYFEHQGSQGYFTVDSYRQLLNDGIIKFEDLPTVPINGQDVHINECVDFRPILINNTFMSPPIVPTQDSTFVSDIEHYLKRVDALQLNKDGVFSIKKGIPSDEPYAPQADMDNLKIYDVHMNAYVYSLKDVDVKFIDSRRFTMKDISKMRDRLASLEYYVTLNLLQQKTINDISSGGIDRTQNGFIVDDFTNYDTADLTHTDFKASFDRNRGELRPKFSMFNLNMEMDKIKSGNVSMAGNLAMLPYNEVNELSNPFATKTVSINPYLVFNKKGSLVLTPNIDTWGDDEHLPQVVTNIDSGAKALQDLASFNNLVGTEWGSWQNMNTTVQRDVATTSSSETRGFTTTATTTDNITISTTNTSARNGVTIGINSRVDSYTVDDNVKDVRIIPYIRSKIVEFYASNMKPNTKLHVLFDGVDVTEHCRIKRNIPSDLTAKNFTDFGGAPIVTDNEGEVVGEFRIPAQTFFNGEKEFILTDSITETTEPTTTATTKYFAGGVDQTKQSTTLNITSPVVTSRQVIDERSSTTVTRDVNVTRVVTEAPRPPSTTTSTQGRLENVVNTGTVINARPSFFGVFRNNSSRSASRDPIAQSFSVEESCFVTSIDLFFATLDTKTSDNIWVEIRTMVNGYPSGDVIIHKDINVNDIVNFVSDDSVKPYNVIFNTPVYVDASRHYCFVVGGHSPDTRLWVSRLGEEVINIKNKIVEEPPSLESSFRSINGVTWNAEQYEFIKYNIYRAEFTDSVMSITMKNKDVNKFKIKEKNPIEVKSGSNRVRVHIESHGLMVNDKIDISICDDLPLTIEVTNGTPPQIGQTLTTPSGSGKIIDVASQEVTDFYTVKLEKVVGGLLIGEAYQCNAIVKEYNDFILFANGNTSRANIQVTQCQGYIRSDIRDSLSFVDIANVDVYSFNKQHLVVGVDSSNSFIIEVAGTFIKSGRFGDNVTIYGLNRSYDSYNVSCEYMEYSCSSEFVFTGIDKDYNIKDAVNIEMGSTNYLPKPSKIASLSNEVTNFGESGKSANLQMIFRTNNQRISPMVNIDTLTFTGISNMVDDIKSVTYNVEPNGTSRYIAETLDGGSEPYKYLTNKVILKKPANEMSIYFDCYKDIDADFDVYIKYGNGDSLEVEHGNWIKFDNYSKTKISSGINQFLEYELLLSKNYTGYNSANDFVWFRVKLVGKTSNTSKPPIFKNLRIVAS